MKLIFFSATVLLSVLTASASDNTSIPADRTLPEARHSIQESARVAGLKSWKISLAPLVASQALDAASSYGMRELNPLLADSNGGFGMKATSIKLGVTGALVGVEYLIVRKYPRSAPVISKLNWTSGIVTAGFAVHNYAIK